MKIVETENDCDYFLVFRKWFSPLFFCIYLHTDFGEVMVYSRYFYPIQADFVKQWGLFFGVRDNVCILRR
ncbi:hypothetical protein B7P33_06210 [Sediminicola luteus]|uniref:Uncharacterized protein n=1 Tax=Sediminicola luteus TaxID=319238 RepID=A0A2A4GAI9_9FLAO|nr:hypothetical protein B7P33_06210 [Sediminicola luteus]